MTMDGKAQARTVPIYIIPGFTNFVNAPTPQSARMLIARIKADRT